MRTVSILDSWQALLSFFSAMVLAMGYCGLTAAVSAGQSSDATRILSFGEFFALSPEQANKGLAVRAKGLVLCYDSEWNQFYIWDGAETRYFEPQRFAGKFEAGQQLEITARTADGAGGPVLTNVTTKVLGKADLPAARKVKARELGNGIGSWVEVIGQVRVADISRGRLFLGIEDEGQSCQVMVMGPLAASEGKRLIGCKVSVQGINNSKADKGQLESAILTSANLAAVKVLEETRLDLRAVPAVSIDKLLSRELGDWTNHPVHVNGAVSSQKAGDYIVVRDPTGVIRAKVMQSNLLPQDERVDLWGYLAVLPTGPVLQDAYFEAMSLAAQPEPPPTIKPAASPTVPSRVLTRISEVVSLKPEEAAQGFPVRVQGVMTYVDASWQNGFLQDDKAAVYLAMNQKDIQSGQWVEVTGKTEAGKFTPEIVPSSIKVLGTTNLPAALKVDLQDFATGALDARWVEMEGVVRRAYIDNGHVQMTLTTRKGRFRILVPSESPELLKLVDATIRIQGACASDLNARGQLSGITLRVPGLDQIQVIESPSADPFAISSTAIGTVSVFNPDRMAGRRIKVSGVVTQVVPGQGFFVQDQTGGIRVEMPQGSEVSAGDAADVLGFPAMGDFAPRLEEAVCRKTGVSTLPVAVKTTAEQILLHGTNDATLVEIEAQLQQKVARSARPKLVLQDGPITFTAHLASGAPVQQFPDLTAGSVLRVRGVCIVQGSEAHTPEAFRLVLSEPKDIAIIRTPSWWTPARAGLLAGSLTVGILLALAWIASLRRRVEAQTEVIRQKLEEVKEFSERLTSEKNLLATLIDHLPDMVFVKDKQGRYVLTNRAHSAFHGMPEDHFRGKTAAELLSPEIARQFIETDEKILSGSLVKYEGEESARDGANGQRWLATTKVPLQDGGGHIIGLVGICHDVTGRKRTELQLAYERDLLKTLLDNLPDRIYFKDLQSRFVRFSKSKIDSSYATALSRHRASIAPGGKGDLPPHLASREQFAEHLIGKTDFDTFSPDRAQAAYDDEQEIIRTGKPLIGKTERTMLPDGRVTWSLTTKMAWHDPEGRLIGTFGVSKDITSIKEAEAKLQEVHKELMIASRQAGMAEVASSVLHNVGNVLNSVNVSASLLSDQLRQSKVANLARAAAMMREHAADLGDFLVRDPRGKQLPGYLEQLAEHLGREHSVLLNEIRSLAHNVEHIKEIVSMQQNYARVVGVAEEVKVTELVEDAIRMNSEALLRHDVHLSRDYTPDAPSINVEKHKVLQVLVNLIRNAKYACDESGRADKRLTVKVSNGDGKVRIIVSDNGVGIPAENLTRIFNHGFTTRKNGHGFGLHSGALAAKEMGGALLVHSDGPGRGASFTLELPAAPKNGSRSLPGPRNDI